MDGKFRRIKISLKDGLSATLDYRQGYFAGKTFGKFTTAEKERQLEDALMLGDPVTELTIAMEIDYFQLNRAEYFVPVVVKIPGRELALARKGGAERTLIDFIGEVKDDYGSTIQNVRDKVDIKLSGETAAKLAKQPIEYDTGFTLLPGKYKIKFLARDAETGRIGTYETTFVIPNLNKEVKRIPVSSVVLEQPACGSKGSHLQCLEDQRSGRGDEPAGSRRPEADSQRDARLQQEPPNVRLLASLRAGCNRHPAAGGLRELLSRSNPRCSKLRRERLAMG